MDISPDIEKKMSAVRCFVSQLITGKEPTFPTVIDDIRDRARYWGWAISAMPTAKPLVNRESLGLQSLKVNCSDQPQINHALSQPNIPCR